MKKTSIILIVALAALVSVTVHQAPAGPPGHPPGPPPHGAGSFGGPPGPPPGSPFGGPPGSEMIGPWDGPPDLVEKLKLTDDQQKQMRAAYVEFREKTSKARNTIVALRDEKEIMMISGKIDQARLAKLDEETTKLASEIMTQHLKMKREHLSKLTPEQIDCLSEFLTKHKGPHGPKMRPR
ncbi:MAG: periplasmic heavy metal sensor [Pseudomonadota bacterium]